MKSEFSRQVFEKAQIPNLIKIRPVMAKFLHEDGRMDGRTDSHDETNSRFPQFCQRA